MSVSVSVSVSGSSRLFFNDIAVRYERTTSRTLFSPRYFSRHSNTNTFGILSLVGGRRGNLDPVIYEGSK